MQEIFKDIKGYEGFYQVSNHGRVKSLARNSWMHRNKCYRISKERILKPVISKGGYYHVGLCNSNRRFYAIHTLMAITFLNHVQCGMKIVIDHIDFNKLNNYLPNLRLITQRENTNRKHLKSTSSYVGVCWDKSVNKWKAAIYINGKSKHIGLFTDELKASKAYETELINYKNHGIEQKKR